MSTSPAPAAPAAPIDAGAPDALRFEEVVQRLDALVTALEDPSLGLDEALAVYEQGTALARHGLARLDAAEARVHQLSLE